MAGILLLMHPLIERSGALQGYTAFELVMICLAGSDFTPFAALLCVIPFASSFCKDDQSGISSYIEERTGIRKYAFSRTLVVALSGGVLMALIMAALFLASSLLAGQCDTVETASIFQYSMWWRIGAVQMWNGLPMYLGKCLSAFLFGAVWALWGLAISIVFPNKYIAAVIPFSIYQLQWYFFRKYPFNPVLLLRGEDSRIPSLYYIVEVQGSWILLLASLSIFGIMKKTRR